MIKTVCTDCKINKFGCNDNKQAFKIALSLGFCAADG